jgi:hypothetical protein
MTAVLISANATASFSLKSTSVAEVQLMVVLFFRAFSSIRCRIVSKAGLLIFSSNRTTAWKKRAQNRRRLPKVLRHDR